MPSDNGPDTNAEHRMRRLLGDHAESTPNLAAGLDADTVIARARRRRRPRQFAVGGASALAVVGLLTVALPVVTSGGFFGGDAPMGASTLAESDMSRDSLEAPEATAMGDLACTSGAQSRAIDGFDVELRARTATGEIDDTGQWTIDVEIVVTNTGTAETTVDVDAASFSLDQDGASVGAYVAGRDSDPVTLAPGDSDTYALRITPVPCDPRDTLSGGFELRAAVLLGGELATSEPITVTAP